MTNEDNPCGGSMEDVGTGASHTGELEGPMDGWIRLALYTDNVSVCKLSSVVQTAIDKLGWEIRNTPQRWVSVRERREADLTYWVALHQKLVSLEQATDNIPF